MDTLNAGDAIITYNESESKMVFEGSMRLANMKEYDVVSSFLRKSIDDTDDPVVLDLRLLQFLNSSGITTLSLFILSCKKAGKPQIKVLGSESISWQQKSISNFKKLWNDVEIVI
ncbi:hypothetical protein KUV50_03470 [Membranicola marinus]|uniref:STAS domain-containing protein n=1 Tax=Membranihabitans marinus TaxID=1227546 RepID=A0A953L807_9BACT|nr:hypothetical protein [Membranihabitans marinus]MBY5957180.1 hypothetical protein [Membranihabitans marinus]